MIHAQVSGKGVGVLELDGKTAEIAADAVLLVRVLFSSLHRMNPAAGDLFRQTFQRASESGELWKPAPVQIQTPPRRPGPKIPTQ